MLRVCGKLVYSSEICDEKKNCFSVSLIPCLNVTLPMLNGAFNYRHGILIIFFFLSKNVTGSATVT